MNGFLGMGATFSADLNLVVQVAMGVALLMGAVLAREKRFVAHQYCQSSVMVLNLVMIGLVMAPSFQRQVSPQGVGGLREGYSAVAMTHAVLGTTAELLGIYIVLVASTNLVPKRVRFKRYKPWMKTALILWWVVVLFGVGAYVVWYAAPPPRSNSGPAAKANAARATVTITNFKFAPPELSVPVGTTVEWIDDTGRHTVEADDGSFKSATLVAGGRFEHRFDQIGVFPYHCTFHGDSHGKGMSGVIKVLK